jgi:Protein of unknown function (DUF2934)
MQVPTKASLLSGKSSAEAVAEQIRHRAYELYEERGRKDGHDLDDWLRAEDGVLLDANGGKKAPELSGAFLASHSSTAATAQEKCCLPKAL